MFDLNQLREFSQEHQGRLWSQEFLDRHHLHGFAYHQSKDQMFFLEWKQQLVRNFIVKSELEAIGRDLQQECLDVCLLKGFSLMGDIYQDWGIRFASDVDLLINLSNLWRLSDILSLHGYRKLTEPKWLGNRFKFMFRKNVKGMEINIEVHSQLFWHRPIDWRDDARPARIEGFKLLGLEKQLVHLCGHLGFQHTFLKLFWLMDIFRFVNQYKSEIHWQRFWNLSQRYAVFKSSYLSLHLCQTLGAEVGTQLAQAPKKYEFSLWILKKIVDFKFLHNPRKTFVRYIVVKNLIKDSFFQNIVYWFYWLKEKVRRRKA